MLLRADVGKEFDMIIVCERCKTRYNLKESIIKKSDFSARCSKCNHIFTVYRSAKADDISFLNPVNIKKSPGFDNIFSISNQKGGVAKTTTCLNLGVSLAMSGKTVLLVDFDAQANLTISLGYRNTESFYEVIDSGLNSLRQNIIKTEYDNLWLLPSNKNMMLLNKKYFAADNYEYLLKDRLASVKDQYDYILIDTPPSVGFFTLNALTTSKLVIIPCQCEYFATHGISKIVKMISLIKGKTNAEIDYKVLITMYDEKDTVSRLICSKIKEMHKEKIFNSIIEKDTKIKEAQIMRLPVINYSKNSKSGRQYLNMAQEVMAVC